MPDLGSLPALPADPLIAAGVCARVGVAVAVGTLPVFPGIPLQVRAALAVLLAVVAVPIAAAARAESLPPVPLLLAGEAIVGLGLGLAVALVLAAAAWAGTLLGSVAGLSWADDFDPEGDAQAAGMGRLAWWLGLAGFLAAGGHLAVVAGIVDSVRIVPIGAAIPGSEAFAAGLARLVTALPASAVSLALALATPALTAVVAFHLAIAVCLRTIRFAPGQGLLQTLASLVLLGAVVLGAENWCGGFGLAARAQAEGLLQGDSPGR
jgi:flagellar biosynthetic protein FliR